MVGDFDADGVWDLLLVDDTHTDFLAGENAIRIHLGAGAR